MPVKHGLQQPQQYRGRLRTGCLTCRSRKVRCDETKPTCRNCAKGQRCCVYKAKQSEKQVVANASRSSPAKDEETVQVAVGSGGIAVPQRTPSSDYSGSSTSNSVCLPETDGRDALGHPNDWSLDVPSGIENGFETQCGGSLCTADEQAETDSPSSLISRDIQLTTTMDILRAQHEYLQSSTVFVDLVECPGITPFDRINWQRAKYLIVNNYKSCQAVTRAITAISTLHHSMKYNLSPARAVDHFRCAGNLLDELLGDDSQDFGTALACIFLLCVFQLIFSDETVAVFKDQSQTLIQRLESWVQCPFSHSSLSKRLIAWLKIIQAITMRGGGGGLLSEAFYELLPNYEGALPFLEIMPDHERDVSNELHEVLGAPLFDFYLQLQILSGRIAKETHYHRSRKSGSDQDEVVSSISRIRLQLQALWESRPMMQRQTAKQIRSQLAPSIANSIIGLIRICNAAYFAEYVEIDRVLGDPLTKWTGSREAIQTIKEIVDDDWEENDIANGKELNSGYLRALFLCAIECMDREQSQWAIRRIREIRSATYRTELFAEFARALSEAQMERERRVTSKYFCIWYFGGPPPFL
ncbi:hypothetical protein FANTH_13047 [Fusarium anthophilum]|uniref:Zn(2)-C6 fungal-type domain-containing protein n=1 Tax=Fusarium anthophilum TaxID=48485 RepID=A0A8H4YQ82_9HYPO|nr:hypothetical protein FANTH_13047 [Fusarium anthophilum]